MTARDSSNTYAQLLREQGCYVIDVAGADWYDYSGFMIPAYLPHCCPVITEESAVEVLRKSKQPSAPWNNRLGTANELGCTWYRLSCETILSLKRAGLQVVAADIARSGVGQRRHAAETQIIRRLHLGL